MRNLDEIVIHCTATKGDSSGDVSANVVRRWHTSPPRNWKDIGYHFLVRRDGTIESGRDLDVQGAHVRGHNETTIAIAYSGGLDPETLEPDDTRTQEQKETIFDLLIALKRVFPTIRRVRGHRDFPGVTKACPCFDVEAEFGFLFD